MNRLRICFIKCLLDDLQELEKLMNDLVLHEIEKVLLEETAKELLESVSLGTTPALEDVDYIGMKIIFNLSENLK